jgi:hypothetical protein
MNKTILPAAIAMLGVATLAPAASAAEPPHAVQVLVFEVAPPNVAKLAEQARRVEAAATKAGDVGKMHIYQNWLAGSTAGGNVVIVIEYPSLVTLAQSATKTAASAEFQQVMTQVGADMQAAGLKPPVTSFVQLEVGP